MKKISIAVALVLVILVQTSCLTSLQPLVTKDKIVTEEKIVGTWQYESKTIKIEEALKSDFYKEQLTAEEKEKNALSQEDRKDSVDYAKSYLVTMQDNGINHYFIGALIKLGNGLYMDFTPITTKNKVHPENDIYNFGAYYSPAFTFARVEIHNGNKLTLNFPDGDFIQQQIKSGNMHIKHEQDNLFGSFLITASSYELQQFVLKYSNDERIYSKANLVTLIKKG